jgi:hypothetical protein
VRKMLPVPPVSIRVRIAGRPNEPVFTLAGGRRLWWVRQLELQEGFVSLLGDPKARDGDLLEVVLDVPAIAPGRAMLGVGELTRIPFTVPPEGGLVLVDAGSRTVSVRPGGVSCVFSFAG